MCGWLYVLWPPVVYAAAIIGQNAPFGVLLAQVAIAGIARRSLALTAVPLGLLLYKPTYALPLIGVLLLRAPLREIGIVAAMGAGWYVASVAATGGDWGWPAEWAGLIARYAPGDLSVNAVFVVSVPGLLARVGAGMRCSRRSLPRRRLRWRSPCGAPARSKRRAQSAWPASP